PARRVGRPGALEAARDGIAPEAFAFGVLPPEALLGDVGRLRVRAEHARVAVAVALTYRVAARRERDRLLVVHRHAREGQPYVLGGASRVGLAVDALRVDVDETHLHGGERIVERLAALPLVPVRGEPLLL